MKALIIEDEMIAAQNLQRLLAEVAPDILVVKVLQSVEETVEFFSQKNDIELIFMDIHLADGLAFHIFNSVTIDSPIIFTTAYDQYALEAFKVNGIDYLLKPIDKQDLSHAIAKLHLVKDKSRSNPDMEQIKAMMESLKQHKYKSYFLIPVRDKLVPLHVNEIAYFYVDEKITRSVTFDNQSYTLDKPLDTIISMLDPDKFFRANRQYIIAHKAVKEISLWPLSKLHVSLVHPTPEKIIVSRARASEFKDWFTN